MTAIYQVSGWIYNHKLTIDCDSPSDLPDKNYVLIEVNPNENNTNIKTIRGYFYHTRGCLEVDYNWKELQYLYTRLVGKGSNLWEKIEKYIQDLSTDDRLAIAGDDALNNLDQDIINKFNI